MSHSTALPDSALGPVSAGAPAADAATDDARCSLSRALELVGERWTFFILREALAGATRFAEFRAALGIAPDVLTARLATLAAGGVLERRPYREPGQRAREAYHLTDSGRRLALVVGALEQWGAAHAALQGDHLADPPVAYRTADGRAAVVRFVDDRGATVPNDAVHLERATERATERAAPRSIRPVRATGTGGGADR